MVLENRFQVKYYKIKKIKTYALIESLNKIHTRSKMHSVKNYLFVKVFILIDKYIK